MAAAFPTSDPTFTTKTDSDTIMAAHVNALQDEVAAIGAWGRDQGDWTAVAFDAGNFTASESMTWTVASGDVATFQYRKLGKSMLVAFSLNTTTVAGTPSTTLRITIPGSFVANKAIYNPVLLIDNSSYTTGYASVAASGTVISITRTDNGNFSAATNTTGVYGQIEFETTA